MISRLLDRLHYDRAHALSTLNKRFVSTIGTAGYTASAIELHYETRTQDHVQASRFGGAIHSLFGKYS
jgi:hypothetical protein